MFALIPRGFARSRFAALAPAITAVLTAAPLVTIIGISLAAFPGSAQAKPKLPVLGFYTSWAPPTVRYDKITHLMYAFLTPSSGGQISGSVPADLVSAAHANGVKIVASIGGANSSSGFPGLAASATGRSAFAAACKSIVDAGCDGVDIDWEFPENATDSTNFSLLVKAVRAAIGASKLLTFELAPTDEKGKWIPKSALDIGDFYTSMAFDFTGAFPGSAVGQHSTYQQAILGVYYWWRNRGVAQNKVILGVPFYGKNFNAGGAAVDYKDIVSANPNLAPDADQTGQTWFNGPGTIKKKATYIAENSYGGVMIWQLGGDAPAGAKSLLDAVEQGLAAPPVVGISISHAKAGDAQGGHAIGSLAWIASQGAGAAAAGAQGALRPGPAWTLRALDGRYSGRLDLSAAPADLRPAAGIYLLEAGHD